MQGLLHLLQLTSTTAEAPAASNPEAASQLGARALECATAAHSVASGVAADASLDTRTASDDPASLTNLAVTMLLTNRSHADGPTDVRSAATDAKALLQAALELTSGAVTRADQMQHGRTLLALAGAHEALGEAAEATACLRKLLQAMEAGTTGQVLPSTGALLLAQGNACADASDFSQALAYYREALCSCE